MAGPETTEDHQTNMRLSRGATHLHLLGDVTVWHWAVAWCLELPAAPCVCSHSAADCAPSSTYMPWASAYKLQHTQQKPWA
eukprot:scaffold159548_cov22-Tisochrysis_lutea.AAC.1